MIRPRFLRPEKRLIEFGPAPALQALPRRFRLCVWNLQKCGAAAWKRDFLDLCAQTDLFLTQEAKLRPCARDAFAASGLHWHGAVSFCTPRLKIPVGIAAGCRAPAREIFFSARAEEPLLLVPKMLMGAVYPLEQTQLLAVNLHAVNFTGIGPFKRNLSEAAHMLQDYQGPVVIAGDFNVWSAGRRRELERVAGALGLSEVRFEPDARTRYLRKAVDFIFIRGLHAVHAQVPPVFSSDHRPLTAVLELP